MYKVLSINNKKPLILIDEHAKDRIVVFKCELCCMMLMDNNGFMVFNKFTGLKIPNYFSEGNPDYYMPDPINLSKIKKRTEPTNPLRYSKLITPDNDFGRKILSYEQG